MSDLTCCNFLKDIQCEYPKKIPAASPISRDFLRMVFYRALECSKLEAMRWIGEKGKSLFEDYEVPWSMYASCIALKLGDLAILDYMFTERLEQLCEELIKMSGNLYTSKDQRSGLNIFSLFPVRLSTLEAVKYLLSLCASDPRMRDQTRLNDNLICIAAKVDEVDKSSVSRMRQGYT